MVTIVELITVKYERPDLSDMILCDQEVMLFAESNFMAIADDPDMPFFLRYECTWQCLVSTFDRQYFYFIYVIF